MGVSKRKPRRGMYPLIGPGRLLLFSFDLHGIGIPGVLSDSLVPEEAQAEEIPDRSQSLEPRLLGIPHPAEPLSHRVGIGNPFPTPTRAASCSHSRRSSRLYLPGAATPDCLQRPKGHRPGCCQGRVDAGRKAPATPSRGGTPPEGPGLCGPSLAPRCFRSGSPTRFVVSRHPALLGISGFPLPVSQYPHRNPGCPGSFFHDSGVYRCFLGHWTR